VSVAICFIQLFYNVFLHRLRSFPGPFLAALTPFPKLSHLVAGDLHVYVAGLHRKYGSVVRISPSELSFTDPAAWKDIHGKKPPGEELMQDPKTYGAVEAKYSILAVPRKEHEILRKALSPNFAASALRAQEDIIGGYVDLLITKLKSLSTSSDVSQVAEKKSATPINMRDWNNYTTFDVLGRLSFGSDFECLTNSEYHPWVKLIVSAIKDMATLQILAHFGLLTPVMWVIQTLGVGQEALKMHLDLTERKTRQRLELKGKREDLVQGLIDTVRTFFLNLT